MDKNVIILFIPVGFKKLPSIPYALLYLERMIRDLNLKIIIIDEKLNNNYFPVIEQYKNNLLLAGVSSMIGQQVIDGIRFSKKVKNCSDAKVVWGGWYPSVAPEVILKEDFVDYIIAGQGEKPFRELVIALMNNKNEHHIKGLGFKENGESRINPPEQLVDDNQFPNVDYSLIDLNRIVEVRKNVQQRDRSLNYIASIGCPYNCKFCCLAPVWGSKYYHKNINTIINDIKYFKEYAGISRLIFSDDSFFTNREFVLNLCNELIKNKINIIWNTAAHVRSFLKNYSDEDIRLIYRSGCRMLKFGVESGDQEVLDRINKRINVNEAYQIAKLLKKHRIKPIFNIMLCFPWNPDRDFKLSLDMLGKAKLINPSLEASVNFFVPLPNTELYKESLKYGYKPLTSNQQIIDLIRGIYKYKAPWWEKNYRKELYLFIQFYFIFANPRYYKFVPLKFRPFALITGLIFYPLIYLRLKYKFRKFPLEAWLFSVIKRLIIYIISGKNKETESIVKYHSLPEYWYRYSF